MMTRGLSLLALAIALGCGSGDVGKTSEPILNGALDADDSSVVSIIVYITNSPPGYFSACSGTVVSPHVVLTAAHCLDPDIVGTIDHVEIFLGTDFTDPAQNNPNLFVDVAQRSFDPKFTGLVDAPAHDLGLVVSATPLTLTPMPLSHDSISQSDVGGAIHAVGFGESVGGDQTSAGPRRFVDTTLASFDGEHLVLDDVVCEGDSGGPSFMTKNGTPTVVGVHSFTTVGNCIGDGDDTRVDVYASSFIDPAINAADPGFLPSGCNIGGEGEPWLLALALAWMSRKKK